MLVGITACGSDDDAVSDVTGSSAQDSTVPTDDAPAVDTTVSATDSGVPADTGALSDVGDVCDLVDPTMLEPVVGTAMSVVTSVPSGCLISNGETGSTAVSISLALIPKEYGGTLVAGCELAARPYVGVVPTTIGEYPGFTGIDLGSSGFTALVCAPGVEFIVTGDTLTRDQALGVAELALAES